MARVRAREAYAFDTLDVVHAFEERREIAGGIVRRLIVIHDLTEKVNLFMAARRRVPDLREDVRHGRIRSCPRVNGTTQNAQKSLQPSMIVTHAFSGSLRRATPRGNDTSS